MIRRNGGFVQRTPAPVKRSIPVISAGAGKQRRKRNDSNSKNRKRSCERASGSGPENYGVPGDSVRGSSGRGKPLARAAAL